MAGQSVGLVTREQSTQEILDELMGQAVAGLGSREWYGSPEGRDAAE
jgi:hypothetical protein